MTEPRILGRSDRPGELMTFQINDAITVAAVQIQRANGAAWRGDRGMIIGETGDGFRIKFDKDGFIADNVKPDEITK